MIETAVSRMPDTPLYPRDRVKYADVEDVTSSLDITRNIRWLRGPFRDSIVTLSYERESLAENVKSFVDELYRSDF